MGLVDRRKGFPRKRLTSFILNKLMENQHQDQGGQGQQQGQPHNQGTQGGESYTSAQNAPQGTGSYGSGYGQAEQSQSGQTSSQMASGDNTDQGGNQQQMGYGGTGTGQYARDSDEDMDAQNNPSADEFDEEDITTDSDMDDTTGSNYRDADSTSDR
jgi:hypothetical protein